MNDARVRRVRFRAWRRGFREADLILGPFADSCAQDFTPDELARFERLLDEADHDLYGWATGAAAVPARLDDRIMDALKAFCRSRPMNSAGG